MQLRQFLLTGWLSSIAIAQQSIIPTNQPTCIQQCQLFKQAQDACVSQQAVQAQYQSCFCQSGYLKPVIQFASTPASSNSVCPACSAADWATGSTWYNGLCGATGANAAVAAAGQTTTTSATTTAPVTAGAGTTSSTSATSSATATTPQLTAADDPANYTDGASWFRLHWQWVVMIIVLAVAFTAIGVIGTILHRRKSRARLQGNNFTAPMRSNPTVDTWAPSRHSVHDFGTPREASPAPAMPPMTAGSDSRRTSRRFGKSPSIRT